VPPESGKEKDARRAGKKFVPEKSGRPKKTFDAKTQHNGLPKMPIDAGNKSNGGNSTGAGNKSNKPSGRPSARKPAGQSGSRPAAKHNKR
jgi:hypothetical protein